MFSVEVTKENYCNFFKERSLIQIKYLYNRVKKTFLLLSSVAINLAWIKRNNKKNLMNLRESNLLDNNLFQFCAGCCEYKISRCEISHYFVTEINTLNTFS
ncbi:hypothetical protein ACKWTF_007980 [Chironomus riparius]